MTESQKKDLLKCPINEDKGQGNIKPLSNKKQSPTIKVFKDIEHFKKDLLISMCWDDKIKIDNKIYNLYEYGGGSLMHLDFDYVYFLNKKSKTLIYIKYHCPSYKYVDGVKIKLNDYSFIDIESIQNAFLWR